MEPSSNIRPHSDLSVKITPVAGPRFIYVTGPRRCGKSSLVSFYLDAQKRKAYHYQALWRSYAKETDVIVDGTRRNIIKLWYDSDSDTSLLSEFRAK